MSIFERNRVIVAAVAIMAAGSILLAVSATDAQADCIIRDGTSSTGVATGSNPTRWKYSDTPYIGARYNSCTNKVSFHYGGYPYAKPNRPLQSRWYNLRLTTGQQYEQPTKQSESAEGERRVAYMVAPNRASIGVSAQFCTGGVPLAAHCTRWSPVVQVALR
jgi:hypothetical protein